MNINKAIRKQKKSYKRFVLSMSFIFVLLPIALFISKIFNVFYIIYLVIIEFLILDVILLKLNEEVLEFKVDKSKAIIRYGLMKFKYMVLCDKIALVHVEEKEKLFDIIILTKSKFRNKRIYTVSLAFLKKYPNIAYVYNKIKIKNPNDDYFYFSIKKGGYKKYILLDALYKNSEDAIFTDEAIEKIKEYRQ